MLYPNSFDVIVIGGGHAGTEAAMAAARMGSKTLLLTQNIETIGQMSCNPAIGGIGKSHLVKEIDSMGGIMAHAADVAGIHFRVLNASKGPAVRATRAQADRALYKSAVRELLENQENLSIFQQTVEDLVVEDGRVAGVKCQMGLFFNAPTVVLTVGTFLGGQIHIGEAQYGGGRAGDSPSNALSKRLRELPFVVDRLKTGTPPRIDGKTINFESLKVQAGDTPTPVFSYMGSQDEHPQQVPCHITYTNEKTHDLIRSGLDRSPMFSGQIQGVGPRYCPSIEDKVVRFADRASHQIFIEPEGLGTTEVYPNGISTSLPFDVQYEFIRSIAGFENAHITRPGYAIEYDYFDPRGLLPWLETKPVKNLFFAGQINGTTGYEEAAAQGLIAGINAALRASDKEPWYPRRDQAYMGVLIDDLITKGAPEPYRMFTSRAEYRLLLREDNADLRLTETARSLGLIEDVRWQAFETKRDAIEREKQRLETTRVSPDDIDDELAEQLLGAKLTRQYSLAELLARPNVSYQDLFELPGVGEPVSAAAVAEQVATQVKYAGYIVRQTKEIERQLAHDQSQIPVDIDYSLIKSLSNEVKNRLGEARPVTIGQASRIPGVTPAAISILLVHIKKQQYSATG